MATWTINGVNRLTTEVVVKVVEAETAEEARAKADAMGVVAIDVARGPAGLAATADGSVDPEKLAAARRRNAVVNTVRAVAAAGCVLSVFMLKTPYVFGPFRPSLATGLVVMALSVGLVFFFDKIFPD